MKTFANALSLTLVMIITLQSGAAHAQGTAFTYQGRLNSGAAPANGSYDLTFSLYDTNQPPGNLVAGPVTNNAIVVSNGLFTTTIDFGPGAFIGGSNWLEIAVSTNGAGSFTTLSPRQQMTPVPYAITAENLASVVLNNAMAGGLFATIGGGQNNLISSGADHSTIAGGGGNSITGGGDTVSGGNNNAAANFNATISGGANNHALGNASVIAGGSENQVTGSESAIGGGQHNANNGDHATIAGGASNYIDTNVYTAFIGAGFDNTNLASDSVIVGGYNNQIQTNAYYSAIVSGANNFNGGYVSMIGGGQNNSILALADHSYIGGGELNIITGSGLSSVFAVIDGGYDNLIQTNVSYSTIGGGYENIIQTGAAYSMIGGGYNNTIQTNAYESVIGGGGGNAVLFYSIYSMIGGGLNNVIQTNAGFSVLGGGLNNSIQNNAYQSVIGGGNGNVILPYASYSSVGGGASNTNDGQFSTISGGYQNTASGYYATIGGGHLNTAGGTASFAAGQSAQAIHDGSFVWADTQAGFYASDRANEFKIRAAGGVVMDVSGSVGLNPPAVSINSTSSSGIGLVVNENSSDTATLFANNGLGDIAKGFHNGNTVFEVKYDGTVISKGVTLTSDRNVKENFTALSGKNILAKVISLPVTEWNYRDDPAEKKHIGPMAQDFHEAFQLDGADDKHISVVDEGGIALAAIQGLNEKLEEQAKEKDAEIQNLEKRLDDMRAMIQQLAAKK